MRIRIVEGGEVTPILSIEEKRFPLHTELIDCMKWSADEDLWRSILIDVWTLHKRVAETRIWSWDWVIQGKEQFPIRAIKYKGNSLPGIGTNIFIGSANQNVGNPVLIEIAAGTEAPAESLPSHGLWIIQSVKEFSILATKGISLSLDGSF